MILIRGGALCRTEGFQQGDVLVTDGVVAEVGSVTAKSGATVVEAAGCVVGPGLVDLHAHMREPGATWKEDLQTGSEAAAAGGFTAILAMPNTEPPVDRRKVAEAIRERGAQVGLVEVGVAGAVTRQRAGLEVGDLEGLYEWGVRVFTDDGAPVLQAKVLREAMERLARLPGAVLAQHGENTNMTRGGHMHEGDVSRLLGVGGLPSSAEEEIVARDLSVLAGTGGRYHCQHVSSAGTVEMIGEAKAGGLEVTAEVTPHHLSLDHSMLRELDPNLKMYPPLRTAEDRAALQAGLRDGTVDAVATDHAPHSVAEKSTDFEASPRGVIGLETAAAVVHGVFDDPRLLFERLSVVPARIAGFEEQGRPVEPGEPANLMVFDPDTRWTPDRFRSKSRNSPFLGMALRGSPVATIFRGRLTHLQARR